MKKVLLLGDEAIAQAALDAGLSGMYAYPGTPSTEIMEFIQSSEEAAMRNIHREWSSNEKTAMEAALGLSYACLLYTSDAADEEDSVDLGGRRIIKKKK